MKLLKFAICIGIGTILLSGCGEKDKGLVADNYEFADQQLRFALTDIEAVRTELGKEPADLPSPRNIQDDGSLRLVRARDWCSGFFPGELWYM